MVARRVVRDLNDRGDSSRIGYSGLRESGLTSCLWLREASERMIGLLVEDKNDDGVTVQMG